MIREVFNPDEISPAEFVFWRGGFMEMRHNYLCAVCRNRIAVIETWSGVLQPCWDCQKSGYKLLKRNWFQRLLGTLK
jgi:ribosomal protein L37AE/L43A